MKITKKMVGAEARKNPAQKQEVILQGKLPNGGMIRLQKRAGKFDTIINSTGYAWHYVAKGTTENDARSVYDYWMTMQNPRRKPTVSRKISQLTREGYPQRQAVAIALSEQRAGKVRANPRLDTKAAKAPNSRASLSARRMVYQVQESRDGKVYEPWTTVLYPEMAKEIARKRAAERPSLFVRVMSFKVEA